MPDESRSQKRRIARQKGEPVPDFPVPQDLPNHHVVEHELDVHFPCDVCNQDCVTTADVAEEQAKFPRVCWDCIEEQAPGFIASIKAKYDA